jgi:hypothetical protein
VAVTAPFCNVTVLPPAGQPFSPGGFRMLSSTASLQDVISAFNNNFSPQRQQDEFNRQLRHDIEGPESGQSRVQTSQIRGQQGQQRQQQSSQKQIPKAVNDGIGKIRFTQMSIVRQKIKVENPKDKDQWVIDDRVKALVMKDAKTGAMWTWQDKSAGKGVRAGTEETTQGEGFE